MKIKYIELENFRIFYDKTKIDFSNKKLILISGNNGHGKSSLFDSIQWCLTGQILRYKGSVEYQKFNYIINEHAISKFDKNVSTSVKVALEHKNEIYIIKRTLIYDRKNFKTKIYINGKIYAVKEGEQKIAEILFFPSDKELNSNENEKKQLANYFSATQILSQDQLHDFIHQNKPQDRFNLMEKVLGLDGYGSDLEKYFIDSLQVIGELKIEIQTKLNLINTDWTRVNTQLEEKEKLNIRLGGITEEQLLKEINLFSKDCNLLGIATSQDLLNQKIINEDFLNTFILFKNNFLSASDKINVIIALLDETEDLFNTTIVNKQKKIEEDSNSFHLLDIQKIKREDYVKKIKERRLEVTALISQNKLFKTKLLESQKINETKENKQIEIASLENRIKSIGSLEKSSDRTLFVEEFVIKKKNVDIINKKIDFYHKRSKLLKLKKDQSDLLNDLENLNKNQILEANNLDITGKKIDRLSHKINLQKNDLIKQIIFDVQQHILRGTENKCLVCGSIFESSIEIHESVKKIIETNNKVLSNDEQEFQKLLSEQKTITNQITSINNQISILNSNLIVLSNELENIEIGVQRLLGELPEIEHSTLVIKELNNILNKDNEFIEKHQLLYNLLNEIEKNNNELAQIIRKEKINKKAIDDQIKIAGNNAKYLYKEEIFIISKIQKIDLYLLETEKYFQQVKMKLDNYSENIKKINKKVIMQQEKEKKLFELLKQFNIDSYNFNDLILNFNDKKKNYSKMFIDLESLLEKLEVYISSPEISKIRSKEKLLREDIISLDSKLKNYNILETQIATLRKEHVGARSDTMVEYLEEYSEAIDRLFMQISPHPIYKHVNLVPKDGKLFILMSEEIQSSRDWTKMTDNELTSKLNASLTFSSAQSNVLAVCIFLSLALSQSWTPLNTIGIDDPFQNMDDINVFSFIDIISQIVTDKQLLISSHNEVFINLIKNKAGLETDQLGYIHFKSYSKTKIDIESNCIIN